MPAAKNKKKKKKKKKKNGQRRAAMRTNAPAPPKLFPGAGWPAGPVAVRPAAKAATPAQAPAAAAEPASAPAEDDGLPMWAAKALEEVLTATYWLDPGEHGDPFGVTIRFSGRRSGMTGKPGPGDTFSQDETIEGIIPGSGPVAITAEVRGVKPGSWTVTARTAPRPGSTERRPFRPCPPPGEDGGEACRVPPPRRVQVTAGSGTAIHTARLLRCKSRSAAGGSSTAGASRDSWPAPSPWWPRRRSLVPAFRPAPFSVRPRC